MATGGYPLSFAQEQLWFLDQLRSGAATEYLLHRAYRLRGPLDTEVFAAALSALSERHEILRTRYDTHGDVAVQIIDDPAPVAPAVIDLSDVPAAEREDRVREIGADVLRMPIDLREQAPWRVTLVRVAADEVVVLFSVHHIAFDGWSWNVMTSELTTIYNAIAAGEPSPLVPLPLQYADYADWQREWWDTAAPTLTTQLDYWRGRLAGLEPLDLPTDRPRPPRWDADGDSFEFTVPADVAAAVTAVGKAYGATPFMVYLAAFQLLLSRYSRKQDIAVGVSVARRDQAELDQLIGLFLNTIVLRTDLSGGPSFTDLLTRVREVTLDAYGNQDIPFERVVADLAPERDLSRNPVFQIGFALQNAQRKPFTLTGIEVERFPTPWASSAFDLSLHLLDRPDGSVVAQLLFPTALFGQARIQRVAAHFVRLLAGVAADPTAPVGRVDLLDDADRRQLVEWNATTAATPASNLPELVAAQAAATPDAIAVVTDEEELTYADLAAWVDALTNHLIARGVGAETPVGVALHRGSDLVVALLAVLAAGGIYVPLPVDHPAERLAVMAEDAGVALVLTVESLRDRVLSVPVVAMDTDAYTILGACPADRPVISEDNAAYVMFTSGSTGRPKGVVITHAGIRNRVLWAVDRYRLGARDRVLQKTTIGFDASVWEFLSPLVSGGAVVMAPEGAHRDPTAMLRAVADHDVTVLQVVPSILRLLVEEPGLVYCAALRLVCSAGEPLPAALCARLRETVDIEVFNTYGPTECSIDATAWPYDAAEEVEIVAIGTPLPNMRTFVVGPDDDLVPVGVPGELCLSGVGLARGYAARGDLTADRFTPNPFGARGERWYRTGDLVRRREDGALEFVGRVDAQVKVRGVRVEPGDIEAALCAHPAVTAAVVTTRRAETGEVELIAYVVPDTIDLADLREHLDARLPAAMIPSVFVTLDALPLTPNGKVDRAALPDPDGARAVKVREHVAPRTSTEQTVAGLMAEVLGVDRIGADDDFFALGGHSLLAIRLVLKLRREFDVELGVGELFTERTVANLAAMIDGGDVSDSAAIQPVPRGGGLPLSFAQQRMWFLDQLEPASAEYLIPLALRLRGPLDVPALRSAVDDVARCHEVLRTRYVGGDGDPVQIIDPPAAVRFDLVEARTESHALDLIDQACGTPFDLAADHPLRITVVRLTAEDHLVAISLHHIAFDAWSMGIFMRDLDAAYQAFAAGEASPLTPPAVQYADFASWQRAQSTDTQLAYWTDKLADLTPVELPMDRPRAALRDPAGDTVIVEVPHPTGQALGPLGQRHGASLFMTLLAAFNVLLGRYTGRADIAVGTPVAGRTRQETEDVLGFLVNNVVLRTDASANPSFVDFLAQVRRVTLEAFANEDVQFEHLVDALRPDRDLSRNPLFQIMFELQHLDRFPTTLRGASIESLHSGTPVAKFDLTLTVKQRADGTLRCWFEYATGLFDRATIERLAAHYLRLLDSIAIDPGTTLTDLDVLPTDERDTLLLDWPDPDGARVDLLDPVEDRGLTVPELVERQAARTPDAVAVVFDGAELTYAELNLRANRFAHHLRALGVGPDVVVGSCMERGIDAVVVLLGTLKSGGVYIPFDPAHPAERLEFMLDDAGAHIVVTAARFADRIDPARRTVLIDGDWGGAEDNPPTLVQPRDLAYVIYTSGSTGRPKGVMIEHRSYAHHCRIIADSYGIGVDDRVVLLSALTFDVAMDQIAATLVAGATIVVSDPVFWTPAELPARLAEHRVTIMEITPAYYREILESSDVDKLTDLRLMNVGSDVVTVSDARRWAATGLPARFLCNYGPTEATVTCVLHPVAGEPAGHRADATLPIGRPVAGTKAFILDADLRPVPLGVPGELCLGGVRLARGYLNRPGLTADRFVPDGLSGEPGARLYRTGDLVRYRRDGVIEFLGRIDHQVKVRGFRIELGEIEAALSRHPAVQAAVVVARDVRPGDKQLVAYLVPRDVEPTVAELRAHLRELLPEYMIPALWVPLAELPLTASKKVDRKALPDPVRTDAERDYVAPRDPGEEAVAGIWADVLGVERVGVHDNFFELGGHSLLATRVLARLRQTFAVDLALRTLFEATTVAELAGAVTDAIEAEIAGLSDADVAELLSREGV
ncbi:putative non-ribosomal peptide synthetase [Alloactinosynnema sp. L-07]|uniref:non-ribosomal peptide synthetase n=1 Tax=Alloactinosynnema sp. L-07 TaxID=1653480 RepID=UPI00065F0954|nr:non-ribosomal peptide synthetase [Alloactinosynnema sp. L-07]CRK57275.1 putative non-ribosomal peptide synthetase [Alloactinosynnema sp. L-07]